MLVRGKVEREEVKGRAWARGFEEEEVEGRKAEEGEVECGVMAFAIGEGLLKKEVTFCVHAGQKL